MNSKIANLTKVTNIEESELKGNIIRIIKGSTFSIVISIILLLAFASALTYTGVPETTIVPVAIIITGISILIGSMISSMKIRKNGILNGGLVGLIYVLFLYILSSIAFAGFSLSTNSIIMIVTGVFSGMIGGIIGVNIK